MSFPVPVDLAERRVTHPARMAVGGVHPPDLKRLVQEHVVRAVAEGRILTLGL